MYEEYAVGRKIEIGKTYLWEKSANYTGEPLKASEDRGDSWVFSYVDRPLVALVVFKSDMDKLIFEQKVLVKEFEKEWLNAFNN